MYLRTRKSSLNFGTYLLLDYEDMKTEKLQHYHSGNSTTMPTLFTMDQKQTNADKKISKRQFILGRGTQSLSAIASSFTFVTLC